MKAYRGCVATSNIIAAQSYRQIILIDNLIKLFGYGTIEGNITKDSQGGLYHAHV